MFPKSQQFEIEVGWGKIAGQIFGKIGTTEKPNYPILCLHGFLDNSNSFRPLASYITKNSNYYMICIDLPGMGLSSSISDGIPYSTRFFVMALRRVILHFNLEKFIFLTHSFGCSIALAYSACYPEQVLGLGLIDFAMKECNIELRDNLSECWREGIEVYLKAEKNMKDKNKNGSLKSDLTYEHALKRLLESNKFIDETAAIILLERGLEYVDGSLSYSRDIRLVTGISMREYHLEFHGVYDCLFKNLSSPVMLMYATPPPYGQKLFDQIMKIMDEIKNNSKSEVELIPVEGTHHFHMLKPQQTSEIILNFLNGKFETNNNFLESASDLD